jgi:hypothetical protein
VRGYRASVRAWIGESAIGLALLLALGLLAPSGALAARIPAATARLYYSSPLRAIRHLYAKRIDEGVDYSGSGPLKAMGSATITVIARGTSVFWANEYGNVVVERMNDGPLKGLSIYNAENCTPSKTLYVGEQVSSATTLCHLHNQFPFMEIGFARRNRSGIPAAWSVYHNYPDGSKTAYGVDFSHLLGDLGAPEGNTNHGTGDQSYDASRTIGHLPHGYPRF